MTDYESSKFVSKGERVYSKHEFWPTIDTNEPWHVNYGAKKSIRGAMLDVNKAFKNLIHAFAEVIYPVFDRIFDWIYPPEGKK